MALTADSMTDFRVARDGGFVVDAGLTASAVVFRGSALSAAAAGGYANALVAGEPFWGICMEGKTGGSVNGDTTVKTQTEGAAKLAISAVAQADLGKTVYASDDNTYTLTATSNSSVGRIIEVPETGTAIVKLKVPGAALGAAQTNANDAA